MTELKKYNDRKLLSINIIQFKEDHRKTEIALKIHSSF